MAANLPDDLLRLILQYEPEGGLAMMLVCQQWKQPARALVHDHVRAMSNAADARMADDYMPMAARFGLRSMVQRCKDWGATDYDSAKSAAEEGDHTNIARQCVTWLHDGKNRALANAVRGGNFPLMRALREEGHPIGLRR